MAKTKHSIDKRGRGWVRAHQGGACSSRRRPRRSLGRSLGTPESRYPARPSPGEGFTLIEVLVAMGIMAMMMISIVQLFVMAAYVNKSVEQRTRLANIAQMQTEELRRIYMSLPPGQLPPSAIIATKTPYDPDIFSDPANFGTHWNNGQAAIYLATTTNDIRKYLPYVAGDTLPGSIALNTFLTTPGSGVEALVAWWVNDTVYGGQGLEVRIDVRSGYVLTNTPFLKDVSINYTTVFASRAFYN